MSKAGLDNLFINHLGFKVRMLLILFTGVVSMPQHLRGEDFKATFLPPPGKVLLIAGQSIEDIQHYENATPIISGGIMSYTSVQRAEGLTEPLDSGGGTQHMQAFVDKYPNTALQIGLYMVDACDDVARGDMDAQIEQIAKWIKGTHRPVYLRIGYEFDGPHNHYPPKAYIRAFKYIVDRFRALKVTNVAFVWHSYASTVSKPLADWYPGDDYVDWFGISYFNQPQRLMQPMVGLAKQHKKPLMICESSPWVVQTKYANSWNLWFAPLFKFIAVNNIKALSYISCDWDAIPMFNQQRWGDARLQSNPEILKRWLQEISQDRYLKSSPELFGFLGFDPNSNAPAQRL